MDGQTDGLTGGRTDGWLEKASLKIAFPQSNRGFEFKHLINNHLLLILLILDPSQPMPCLFRMCNYGKGKK